MFKKTTVPTPPVKAPVERVTSVLGPGITWSGNLGGKGGIRIEGTFEGQISIRGLVVIGETGRVTCPVVKANNVIVAGSLKGNVMTEKLEIRSTGRVWGDVVTTAFSTEEGAFLRGQVRMEDKMELNFEEPEATQPAPVKENAAEASVEATKPVTKTKTRKVA
ncbi:MAG: polymer-forming cytoskeletal protein [Anaerolineaceae bacterium]|nr:polymer-forming cytoskeletal protein [Anaerolineaceae bacterium]